MAHAIALDWFWRASVGEASEEAALGVMDAERFLDPVPVWPAAMRVGCFVVAVLLIVWGSWECAQQKRPAYAVGFLALAIALGYAAFGYGKGDMPLLRESFADTDDTFGKALPPRAADALSPDVINRACEKAGELLSSLACDEKERQILGRLSVRLPELVGQLDRCDETRRSATYGAYPAGVLAETIEDQSPPIRLYALSLRDEFSENAWVHGEVARRAQSDFLAYILVHEVFHLSHRRAGILQNKVPGDQRAPRGTFQPSDEHVGLIVWVATLAQQEIDSDKHSNLPDGQICGACAFVKQAKSLLELSGPHSEVLRQSREAGRTGTLGPPLWNVPSSLTLKSKCGKP